MSQRCLHFNGTSGFGYSATVSGISRVWPYRASSGLCSSPSCFGVSAPSGDGVWLAASSIVDIAGGLGFGLGLSIVREVARGVGSSDSKECERLVGGSRIIYLALGVTVLIALALASRLFSAGLHLTQNTQTIVRPVFILVGVTFLGDQLSACALAVLAGLRRFDLIGITAIAGTIANALLTFLLLRAGHSDCLPLHISAIAIATAIGTSTLLASVRPTLGLWNSTIDLRVLLRQSKFIFAIQANTLIGKAVFDGAVTLIGFILGANAIVPFRIGQKLPQFLAVVSGRVAEVLYPASSSTKSVATLKIFAMRFSGTRILVFANVPVLALLFLLAPHFLYLWIPAAPPEAVAVLRVYVLAILLDVPSYAADNLLWGTGEAKFLLRIMTTSGVVTLVVGIACMLRFGVVGMAIGTAAGLALSAVLLVMLSSRKFELPLGGWMRFVTRGSVTLPARSHGQRRDGEEEKVEALEQDVDDCLTKAFSIRELIAPVRTAHRRIHAPVRAEGAPNRIGEIRLIPARHSVPRRGQAIHLTRKEYDIPQKQQCMNPVKRLRFHSCGKVVPE